MSQQEFISTPLDRVINEAPPDTLVKELDRQTAQGAMHAHSVDSHLAERLNIVESMFYGLVDLLVNKRAISESELAAAANHVAGIIQERGEQAHGGVALRIDPADDQPFTPVNCAERMPVCKAICCRLSFPLTPEEVQSGQLKWELGRPYFIRHNSQGACVHQNDATGACGVYDKRPSICKRYSCATDTRIWKDFDRMILNQEWLDENLGPERPQLVQIRMDAT